MTLNNLEVNLLLCRPCYVYCYQKAEARIMQLQLSLARCRTTLPAKFGYKIQKGSLLSGAQTGVGSFSDFAMLYLGNGARWSLGSN